MSERGKFEARKKDYYTVLLFLEWCRWHGVTLVGPHPFTGDDKNIDLVRSETLQGSPFEELWCRYIGVDYTELEKEQNEEMRRSVQSALDNLKSEVNQ